MTISIEKKHVWMIMGLMVVFGGIFFADATLENNVFHGPEDISPGIFMGGGVYEFPNGIRIGPSSNEESGTLRWTGTDEVYDGSQWKSIGGSGAGTFDLVNSQHSTQQCEGLDGEVVDDGAGNKFC